MVFCRPSRCDGSSGNTLHLLPSSAPGAEASFSCGGSSCRAPVGQALIISKTQQRKAFIFKVQLLIEVLHLSDASLRPFLASVLVVQMLDSEFLFWAVSLQLVSSGLLGHTIRIFVSSSNWEWGVDDCPPAGWKCSSHFHSCGPVLTSLLPALSLWTLSSWL